MNVFAEAMGVIASDPNWGSKYKRRKPARGLIWAPKETRQQRLDRVGRNKRVERATTRLFAVLGLRDEMTRDELISEGHFAYHRGLITKRQLVVLKSLKVGEHRK